MKDNYSVLPLGGIAVRVCRHPAIISPEFPSEWNFFKIQFRFLFTLPDFSDCLRSLKAVTFIFPKPYSKVSLHAFLQSADYQ